MSSGHVVSGGSQAPPSPYGMPPVLAKTAPHTSLSITLANHTPNTSPNKTSTMATATQGNVNADSAQTLLKDVRNESDSERQSRKGKFQWKSRGSVSKDSNSSSSSSSHRKQYAKMGLLMDSPTKHAMPSAQWPRVTSDSMQVGMVSEDVGGGFEVVRLEGEGDVQASPPISVKSESVGSAADQEGPASSPDSGYGNTPDNPGDHLAGRTRSGAIMESKRAREDTQDSACGMEPSPRNSASPHPHLHHSASLPPTATLSTAGGPHRTTPTAAQLRSVGESTAGERERGGERVLASLMPTTTGAVTERHQLPQDNHVTPSSLYASTLPHSSSPNTRRRRFRTSLHKQQFSRSSGKTSNSLFTAIVAEWICV